MAERINWTQFTNQAVYGHPAPWHQRMEWGTIPEAFRIARNHPFATRVREAIPDVIIGAVAGGVARTATRAALAGIEGLAVPILAGAAAAAATEYGRQVHANIRNNPSAAITRRARMMEYISNPTYLKVDRAGLKKIGWAAGKGALGGLIGAELADLVVKPLAETAGTYLNSARNTISAVLSSIPNPLDGLANWIKTIGQTPAVPTFTPTPVSKEAAIRTATPRPTETSTPSRPTIEATTGVKPGATIESKPALAPTEVPKPAATATSEAPKPSATTTLRPTETPTRGIPTQTPTATNIPGRVPGGLPTPTMAPTPDQINIILQHEVPELGIIGATTPTGAHLSISIGVPTAAAAEFAMQQSPDITNLDPAQVFAEGKRMGLSSDQIIKTVRHTKAFQDFAGSETYKQLHLTDKAVEQLIAERNIKPSELSLTMIETLKKAAQRRLEDESYAIFNKAFEEALIKGDSYDEALKSAAERFAADVNTPTELRSMVIYAQNELVAQSNKTTKILAGLQNLIDVDKPNPELYQIKEMPDGSTLGHEVKKMGVGPDWRATPDGANWRAALLAVDYMELRDFYTLQVENGFLPADSHFPLNMSEIEEWRVRAANGDLEASEKLNEALRRIRAGKSVTLLTKKGVAEIVKVLQTTK